MSLNEEKLGMEWVCGDWGVNSQENFENVSADGMDGQYKSVCGKD